MKDETFDVALWGLDWDSIDRGEHLFQGITALNACCLALDIPFGTLFNRGEIAKSLSESGSFPALYGIDLKGKYCVLRNLVPALSEEHFPGGTHEVCRAQYLMISDTPFNHAGRIVKLHCSFSHLDQWSENKLSKLYPLPSDETIAISIKERPSDSRTLFQDDWGSIDLVYSVDKRSFSSTSFGIEVGCHIVFTFNEPVDFDIAVRDYLAPFNKFLSFCMGAPTSVEALSFVPNGPAESVRVIAGFPAASMAKLFKLEMPVALDAIFKASSPLIDNWLRVDDELKAACNLTVSLLARDGDKEVESFLLESAQLLEMMAKYRHERKRFSDDELKRRTDLVLSSISGLDHEIYDWVRNRLDGANGFGQHRLLRDLLKSLGAFAEWLVPDKERFLSKHVEMRNSLTHRDSAGAARFDTKLLAAHSRGVLVLSYGAILLNLGLSDKEVIAIVKRPCFSRTVRNFQGLYPSN